MISAIVPCLWANEELFDMTVKCLRGIKEVDELIVINRNRSYAGNVNAGLKIAEGDIIIVANNDIEFYPGWLHHITWPLEEYDICSIMTSDQGWETKDELEEGAKFGSLFAMKRKVYDTIGGFDEELGHYFIDLDYQKRAEDAGFRVVKNHAGLVRHVGKATFKQVDPEDKSYLESMEKFRKKYGKIW